jgi:hypothetical protein
LKYKLKIVVKENFEFLSTRNGTRVITRGMADFLSIKSHFDTNNLSHYSFYPKSEKPMKEVIRQLPRSTPAEDISDGLVSLGFDVISVKQMTATRRSPAEGSTTINFPLPSPPKIPRNFLTAKPQHIAFRVETYRAQNGLTQCHNCQQFSHIWANCKQPSCCLWCGGGHQQKECPEKGNTSFIPTCCNWRLVEGEKSNPANYRGCRHAKEEMQKNKSQRTPRTATGSMFSSNLATPGMSFAAALRRRTEQQQQPQTYQVTVAGPATLEPRVPASLPQYEQQTTCQLFRAPNVNNLPLEKMLKVAVFIVQQIMTEFNAAVLEEAKIVAITKILLNLIEQNDH